VELIARRILPAGQGGVVVRWNPGPDERALAITVKVPTSDPGQQEVELLVRGTVRQRLYADPSRITFTSVVSRTGNTQRTLIYSHVWDEFEIENLESSCPEITWEISAADAGELAAVKALSGHVLRVSVPENLPEGSFNHWLRFAGRPTDPQFKPELYQIAVEGNVQRRLAIYGNEIDDKGTIDFGVVQRGTGKQARLVVKVRDADTDLQLRKITTNPEFVQAKLTPAPAKAGLYFLDVTVPPNAPKCEYLLTERGTIRLEYGHSRIGETNLKLRFAVAAPDLGIVPQ
jgi:hypothetical protein